MRKLRISFAKWHIRHMPNAYYRRIWLFDCLWTPFVWRYDEWEE